MRKLQGRPVDGSEFFALLCEDDEFCAQLGRAMLAAGRFETALKRHLHSEKPKLKTTYAHLGALLEHLKKHQLLGKMHPHIELLKRQRNYLAHSIHALLTDWVGETILERDNLLDSDLSTYTDRARELTDNLNALSEIVEGENCLRTAGSCSPKR